MDRDSMNVDDSAPESPVHSRRRFLDRAGGAVAAATMVTVAGCSGGGNGDGEDGIRVPALYDLSGGTADVGRPTGVGSRDAMAWINENDVLDEPIVHDWVDYAYEVPQAQQRYDSYTSNENPPIIIGWGTADTEALASDVAADEIVYISASYSDDLLAAETGYNFFANLDYTSQGRAHLQWISNNDPDATIAYIHNTTPFGEAPVEGGEAYAEELGLEVADNIALELDANSAGTQVQRAEDNGVDYLIHQNTAAPMQVLLSSIQERESDITVMGLTWTVDEFRAQTAPELFEGVRYVNSNVSFAQARDSDARGWEIIEDSFEREGHEMDDPEIANINYVRGVVHALLAVEAIQQAQEMGLDPNEGANVREALFEMDDFDAWGLLPETYDYQEGDRRPTMSGQTYVIEDGEMVPDEMIELERREDWLP
jgi:branched-chain amino acid transport system substrate-binding protein